MNHTLMALPPAVVGVMADVNSHIIVTLNAAIADRRPSVSTRNRHARPNSRPATARSDSDSAQTVRPLHGTRSRSDRLNSRPNSPYYHRYAYGKRQQYLQCQITACLHGINTYGCSLAFR